MSSEIDSLGIPDLGTLAETLERMATDCHQNCVQGINTISTIIKNISDFDKADIDRLKKMFHQDLSMLETCLTIANKFKVFFQSISPEPEQKDRIIKAMSQLEGSVKEMSDACNEFIKVVNSTTSLDSYENFSEKNQGLVIDKA